MSMMLGNRYLSEGRYAEALAQFQQALSEGQEIAEAHYKQGISYLYLGLDVCATTAFEAAILLERDRVELRLKLILTHIRQRSLTSALEALGSLLTDATDALTLPLHYGYLYAVTLDDLTEQAEQEPTAELFGEIGVLYLIQGAHTKALESWRQSLTHQPEQPLLRQVAHKFQQLLGSEAHQTT